MKINSLVSGTGNAARIGKTQRAEKTAKSAITDSFVEKLKKYAKEDAKQGVYMSKGFIQFRLSHMKQFVSPDRSGPKADVMSAIQAALKEPHPMLYALEKMLDKLSGGCSANLKISGIQQAAEVYGWTDIQTKEEHRFFSETASLYHQAYREARAEMKAATQEATVQDSASAMDVRV